MKDRKIRLLVSDRGNITLPAKLREYLGRELIADFREDGVFLQPAFTVPVEIYSDERIKEFDAEEKELGKILNDKNLL